MELKFKRNADGTLKVSNVTKLRAINWINDLEYLMNLSIPQRLERRAELSRRRIENASL